MATVYDVPGDILVREVSKEIEDKGIVEMPEWAKYVKTGTNKERPPEEEDWWFKRAASILRRVYIDGPAGVESLRSYYGGRKKGGHGPDEKEKGSGKVIRTALQNLEEAGYVDKSPEGRTISGKGQSFLDSISTGIKEQMEEEISSLEKY